MPEQISFSDRIKRISDPRNTYYVDGETGAFIPKRVSRDQIRRAKLPVECKPTLFGLAWAVLLGALSLMAARYMRWHYLQIDDASSAADTLMMIDFGLAGIAVFALGGLLRQKSLRHMLAQTAGIAVMLVGMHNLVWLFPEEFAQVYSQAYVEQVQAVTAPQSLYLRGESVRLDSDFMTL